MRLQIPRRHLPALPPSVSSAVSVLLRLDFVTLPDIQNHHLTQSRPYRLRMRLPFHLPPQSAPALRKGLVPLRKRLSSRARLLWKQGQTLRKSCLVAESGFPQKYTSGWLDVEDDHRVGQAAQAVDPACCQQSNSRIGEIRD